MEKFNIEYSVLAKVLFSPEKPKYGPNTKLNMHYLPNLLAYLKSCLQEEEKLCLIDYELESLLIELSISHKQQDSVNFSNLGELKDYVITQLRAHSKYWVRNSNVWNKIHFKGEMEKVNDEEKEKNLKAMDLYNSQIECINKKSQYCRDPQLKNFTLNRRRNIVQNYEYFSMCLQKQKQDVNENIDMIVVILLNQYLTKEFNIENRYLLQKFLLDMSFGTQARKKKKKYGSPEGDDLFQNGIFQKFSQFCLVQKINLKSLMYDAKKEEIIIINIIRIFTNVCGIYNNQQINQQDSLLNNSTSNFLQLKRQMQDQLLSQAQILGISKIWCLIYQKQEINVKEISRKNQISRNEYLSGCLNTVQEIENAKAQWIEIQEAPQIQKLNKYKYHTEARIEWSPDQYKAFLQGLLQYLHFPVNNKKIANYVGKDIEPNHVKFVKGSYLRNLKKRMSNGECGGGKKGECSSKKQFLQRDIQNFNMKWFQRTKVNKQTKKRKRIANSQSSQTSSEVY